MYNKVVLDNGVRLVYETIPYVRSVSIGVWIATGSRNENKQNNGISHFIEHMFFKGTKNRTAKEIAESIDNLGGQLNAFTGKECTCYYTKTLDTHIHTAFDVLSDMLFNSKFLKKDIDLERKVILEEIGMYEDSPEELVHDILSETVWNGNSLGYPILGIHDSLKSINRKAISDYMGKNYTPDKCVISVAGNFEESTLLDLAKKYFGKWDKVEGYESKSDVPVFNQEVTKKEKDIEQAHLCIGFNGIEQGNDNLYTLLAVNNILGGGMSSRLFQKIREEKGLVYSIYSYPSSYKDAGLFTIYGGMNPVQVGKVMGHIKDEISELIATGITKEELSKSKEQLKGNYILGLESTSSRMNSIGKSELLLRKIYTPDEVLKKIDDINMENAVEVINRVFNTSKISFSVVGNFEKEIDFKEYF